MKRLLAMCLTTGVAAHAGGISGVPANTKADGYAPASQLTREWRQHPVAQGAMPVENPDGIVGWYGYENDSPSPADPTQPQMLPTPLSAAEAQKTEPDKNTYLVLRNQQGADPHYNYGTHFLFQGHELGAKGQAYITRINLDADTAHRVTLMATHDVQGNPIAPIDGSTWDPWAQRLLFTTESTSSPTYAATLSVPSQVEDVSGALGRGGYEGIQNDSYGNISIVEDIGGSNKTTAAGGSTVSKRPNSFLYRYVPRQPDDLHNGKLQVLQVLNSTGAPITFESQADLFAPDQVALRTAGTSYKTQWVTIHDTAVDGTTPFNANTAAKAHHGTPFKRPENGVFRPGSHFREFFFDETGDTNATSLENAGAGGWASIFKLVQHSANADEGRISIFYQGNQSVAGLDNICFLSEDKLLVVEDAGDGLHTQRKALDSGFLFDVDRDYSHGAQPIRFLAEGRDASATIDSGFGGFGKNEGDNEITGIHVSDGDPSVNGILGAKVPRFGHDGWRMFWTQQHGDNVTWEVTPASHGENDDDHDDW